MVTKEEIKNNLEYLGLDLENLNESFTKDVNLGFTVSKLKDDRDLKVYKYIPIEDIEIFLTPHNKGEELRDRYNDAKHISHYLKSDTEDVENYARYLEFINLFKYFNKEQIEEIEEEQKKYYENIPFEIRYDRSHMWSIYYDEKTKKYFMLVCTKEADFTELFYLIKKKIEICKSKNKDTNINSNSNNNYNDNKEEIKLKKVVIPEEYKKDKILSEYFSEEEKDLNINSEEILEEEYSSKNDKERNGKIAGHNKYIYAPINYISLSEKYITPNELLEIENYLWYFTKNWPITFDCYDINNNHSLIIKGETSVFDRLESDYKFTIKTKEDAIKLYKHLKALFTLESATDKYFNFKSEIKRNFELKLTYEGKDINFDDIPDFIYKKYNLLCEDIEVLNSQNKSKTIKLNMLRDDLANKEQIYREKQNEVVQYLECKKSFTKKVKYFFRRNSRVSKTQLNKSQIKEEVRKKIEADRKEVEVDYTVIDTLKSLEKKEFYTIDDFIFVYSLYEKLNRKVTELTLDIRAMKLALLNINNRLTNVEIYLEEIDQHKKSIFEFWRFTNKDKVLSLEEAGIDDIDEDIENKEEEIPLERIFNFDMDIDAIAEKMDEVQRRKLSREEINSIFLINSGFIQYINMLKIKDIDEYAIISFLDDLKRENKENSKYIGETFDVFGSVMQSIETRYLKTNEFREVDRNKFKILGLTQDLDKFKFIEKLTESLKYIDESMLKIKTNIEIPIYKAIPSIEKLEQNKLEIFNIDARDELKNYTGVGNNINLIKINLPKDSSAIFYTNIIYYENQNNTLPLGMDVEKKVLIDLSKFKLKENLREKIVVNKYFKTFNNEKQFKNINIIEYDIIGNIIE